MGNNWLRLRVPLARATIEANESLSKKDFRMRIKICRKEAKESRYWLKLIDSERESDLDRERITFWIFEI